MSDNQTATSGIHLSAGDMITCENGHPFGRVKHACEAGKGDWSRSVDWLQYTRTPERRHTVKAMDAELEAPAAYHIRRR